MHCVRQLLHWAQDWFPDVLPAISNLILVLLGIIMSLPTLADKIEKTPRYRKWLAAVCLVFGMIGFGFDVLQRHSTDKSNKELLGSSKELLGKVSAGLDKTDGLVQQTTGLIADTKTLVGDTKTLERCFY